MNLETIITIVYIAGVAIVLFKMRKGPSRDVRGMVSGVDVAFAVFVAAVFWPIVGVIFGCLFLRDWIITTSFKMAKRKEVEELAKTIESMKKDADDLFEKVDLSLRLFKNIEPSGMHWWDEEFDVFDEDQRSSRELADKIKGSKIREEIHKKPSIRRKEHFSWSCSDCVTPLEDGIGKCLGCRHSSFYGRGKDLQRNREEHVKSNTKSNTL